MLPAIPSALLLSHRKKKKKKKMPPVPLVRDFPDFGWVFAFQTSVGFAFIP